MRALALATVLVVAVAFAGSALADPVSNDGEGLGVTVVFMDGAEHDALFFEHRAHVSALVRALAQTEDTVVAAVAYGEPGATVVWKPASGSALEDTAKGVLEARDRPTWREASPEAAEAYDAAKPTAPRPDSPAAPFEGIRVAMKTAAEMQVRNRALVIVSELRRGGTQAREETLDLASGLRRDLNETNLRVFVVAYTPDGPDALVHREALETLARGGRYVEVTDSSALDAGFATVGESLDELRR